MNVFLPVTTRTTTAAPTISTCRTSSEPVSKRPGTLCKDSEISAKISATTIVDSRSAHGIIGIETSSMMTAAIMPTFRLPERCASTVTARAAAIRKVMPSACRVRTSLINDAEISTCRHSAAISRLM